jgi:hypothetical protein
VTADTGRLPPPAKRWVIPALIGYSFAVRSATSRHPWFKDERVAAVGECLVIGDRT